MRIFENILETMEDDGFCVYKNVVDAATAQRWTEAMMKVGHAHAHSRLMWDIRRHENVQRVFADIWKVQPSDLLCSFDGGTHRASGEDAFTLPWHVDQDASHGPGCINVQGVLALQRVDKQSGGTAFARGSHKSHAKWVTHVCDEWEFVEIDDQLILPDSVIQPVLEPGDMVIWDNRCTVHAATGFDHERHAREMWRTTLVSDRT